MFRSRRITPDHFDKVFNPNGRAPVFLVQKLPPLMTRGGSIILVKMYRSMIPIGRFAKAEELGNATVFLASDQSPYMTGSDLMVDGGVGQV